MASGDEVPAREILYYLLRGAIMSFRNGDKSREHRIRKARQKKRETLRDIKGKGASQSQPAPTAKKPA
jgi:hypothetical protein